MCVFCVFWQTLLWQWLAVTLGKAATPSTAHPKIVYWDTKCCRFCLFDFLLIHFGFDLWLPLHLNKDPETAELVKCSSVHFCQRSVSISSLLRLLCTSKNASVNETSKTPFRSWLREGGGAVMIPNQRKQKLFIRSYLGFILTVRHFSEVWRLHWIFGSFRCL